MLVQKINSDIKSPASLSSRRGNEGEVKLGIISDCIHYKSPDGRVGTENHILLRQLQALSAYFTNILICCPFTEMNETKVISWYTNQNIQFHPVPLVGGDKLKDKLSLFKTMPKWWKGYKAINRFSDIVYQRFPNNINIPGFFYFYFNRKKVFATYTGTWADYKGEPSTYRLQKWLLKKYFRGPVWVYVEQARLSNKIFGGFSPSYSQSEWEEETEQVAGRIQDIQSSGINALKLITVGTLIDYKNQLTILKACVNFEATKFSVPFNRCW